jgi:hypothetical protein
MDIFWIVLIILLTFLFVLVVMPCIIPASPGIIESPQEEKPKDKTVTPEEVIKDWENEESRMSKAMLDQQFQPARNEVPENYPRKEIGACPYVKAPSTALRMMDTPMKMC